MKEFIDLNKRIDYLKSFFRYISIGKNIKFINSIENELGHYFFKNSEISILYSNYTLFTQENFSHIYPITSCFMTDLKTGSNNKLFIIYDSVANNCFKYELYKNNIKIKVIK